MGASSRRAGDSDISDLVPGDTFFVSRGVLSNREPCSLYLGDCWVLTKAGKVVHAWPNLTVKILFRSDEE